MINLQDKESLKESTTQWVRFLDVFRSEMPSNKSRSFIREVFATFLLLRWVDSQEAEQEAMAIFEDRAYQSLLPELLQWRNIARLENPQDIAKRLHELAGYVEGLRGDAVNPVAAYLHTVAEPLRRILEVNFVYLIDIVHWVGELPFETPSKRRKLLDVFDQVINETRDVYDDLFSTPANIAHFVTELANPQPGDRIYDPCFGSANFIIAAWQHAQNSSVKQRRPGALLEVAGIEINTSTFLIGLVRMLLAGVENPRLELGDSRERDLLSSPSQQGFDVIIANPPIGAKIRHEPQRYQHFPIPTKDSTCLFVQHVLSQLKPNGRAVIVVPEGFLFRGGAERELRRHLLERGFVEAVIALPPGILAPFTGIKLSLLVLCRQGGNNIIRMADASTQFDQRSGRKAPVIRATMAQQFAAEVMRTELHNPRRLPPDTPEISLGSDVLSRSVWEMRIDELAEIEWELTPRRREKGALDELLSSLKDQMDDTNSVVSLTSVADIYAGRHINKIHLIDTPPAERKVGYVRIRDLSQGKVGHISSWLLPNFVEAEHQWALQNGDILVSKSGTIGKSALVQNGAVGSIASNGLYVLRTNKNMLHEGFLLAYLSSPACQNWLAAYSSGTTIQHLNRKVLNKLQIPLPPMDMQYRVASQFREFGTDALSYLSQELGGSDYDRISVWLAELDSKVPRFVGGMGDTPELSRFEILSSLAKKARDFKTHDRTDKKIMRWLIPLNDALQLLVGIAQIPQGPSLLNVLQQAERDVQQALNKADGHLPIVSQARNIIERIIKWLQSVIAGMLDAVKLEVIDAPPSLTAGEFIEFYVVLENVGALPLRNLHIESHPDWGAIDESYLAENKNTMISLKGDVPKEGKDLSMHLHWQAQLLNSQKVDGEIELAIRVVKPEQEISSLASDLRGSPYVTGSPLEPQHGHSVFYGREELIGKISRQISTHGNVVLLEGNRRAGKTSVLKHLEGRTAIPGWLAVYSSLQGAKGATNVVGVPTAEVFRLIAVDLAKDVATLGTATPLPDGTNVDQSALSSDNKGVKLKELKRIRKACRSGIEEESAFDDLHDYLDVLLSVAATKGLGIVLMLDEFDKLQEGIDNGVTSPQVPENIRFLIQTYPKFSAILTGSRRLKRLREEYWSALYGLGTSISVKVLDVESARKVITEPIKDQLAFSRQAVDRVIEITARHPYLMQCICNRIFDYAVQTKGQSITASVVNKAASGLVRDNEHFASLWDYAGMGPNSGRHRRQFILLLCTLSFKHDTHISFGTLHEQLAQEGVEIDDVALDLDLVYLRELELVEFSGEIGDGEYRLAIPLMADWIEQQQDAVVVTSRAQTEAEEENV
jgi:type I restriction enzyme M protein